MANQSIYNAFERMWLHVMAALGKKADVSHMHDFATIDADGFLSKEDKIKLDGIEAGAQINVQSDWSQEDEAQADYIKNKPEIATPDDALDIIAELNIAQPVASNDGKLFASNTGAIYTL